MSEYVTVTEFPIMKEIKDSCMKKENNVFAMIKK
jgi:hypothetical protein